MAPGFLHGRQTAFRFNKAGASPLPSILCAGEGFCTKYFPHPPLLGVTMPRVKLLPPRPANISELANALQKTVAGIDFRTTSFHDVRLGSALFIVIMLLLRKRSRSSAALLPHYALLKKNDAFFRLNPANNPLRAGYQPLNELQAALTELSHHERTLGLPHAADLILALRDAITSEPNDSHIGRDSHLLLMALENWVDVEGNDGEAYLGGAALAIELIDKAPKPAGSSLSPLLSPALADLIATVAGTTFSSVNITGGPAPMLSGRLQQIMRYASLRIETEQLPGWQGLIDILSALAAVRPAQAPATPPDLPELVVWNTLTESPGELGLYCGKTLHTWSSVAAHFRRTKNPNAVLAVITLVGATRQGFDAESRADTIRNGLLVAAIKLPKPMAAGRAGGCLLLVFRRPPQRDFAVFADFEGFAKGPDKAVVSTSTAIAGFTKHYQDPTVDHTSMRRIAHAALLVPKAFSMDIFAKSTVIELPSMSQLLAKKAFLLEEQKRLERKLEGSTAELLTLLSSENGDDNAANDASSTYTI